MPERRKQKRPGSAERRSFPRPPLWLNLLILLLGIAGVVFARYHRERVSTRFAGVISAQQRTPADVAKVKEELAEMNLTEEALRKELDARTQFAERLNSEDFYLSLDTQQRKLRFHYGDAILRESEVIIGEQTNVESGENSWTFIPVKGTFKVEAKVVGYDWEVPEWLYAMKNEPVPPNRPTIDGGLGRYVIFLGDGYVIHSPPPEESPLDGPKPGSYMVTSEDDMRAIWPRITKDKTQVYIF